MVCSAACLVFGSAAASTQQHIRHIEDHLLPATTVNGQRLRTTTLIRQMRESGVPGVSIAFFRGGRIEWTDAVGVTHLGGAAVDSNTVFQAASISKPLTAIAVLSLKQSGKLDLDRDVNDYLGSWKLPEGRATATEHVTIRRLLNHTAGVSVHGFDGYPSGQSLPSLIEVLNGAPPANSPPIRVTSLPGTGWSYSGGGYVILEQLLNELTGTPFVQLMDQAVLKPAGMHRSSFEQPVAAGLRANAAAPYDAKGQPVPGGAHTYPEEAPAGLWTTPTDLARLAINLQHSLAGKPGILLQETAREMLQPGKGSWGLGFRVGGGDHPYFMHGGWNAGFRSILIVFGEGDGIAVMTNGDGGLAIMSALVRTVAAEYGWPAFKPGVHKTVHLAASELDRFVGNYRLDADVTITVSRKGERLNMQIADDAPSELTAEGRAAFFSAASNTQVTFQFDAHRRAANVRIDTLLATYDGTRLQ